MDAAKLHMNDMLAKRLDDSDDQDRIWLDLVGSGGKKGEAALESLFRKYRLSLISFLVRRGASAEVAEELVQEAFIRIARTASGFRHDARVSSWMFQIAKNLYLDQCRKNTPETNLDDDAWLELEARAAANDSTEETLNTEGLQDCFDGAFGRFAHKFPERAEVLRHVVLHRWSVRDVASFLNRTEGATREYLSQCRKKLKQYLEPCRHFLSGV